VEQTEDGGYLIAGTSDSAGGSLLLIKTDSLGGVQVGLAEGRLTPDASRPTLDAYPNPARGTVSISCSPFGDTEARLTMYDVSGGLVYSSFVILTSSFRLDLRSIPAGVYVLRLESDRGSATRKLVIE
jgi:hypothetical protein